MKRDQKYFEDSKGELSGVCLWRYIIIEKTVVGANVAKIEPKSDLLVRPRGLIVNSLARLYQPFEPFTVTDIHTWVIARHEDGYYGRKSVLIA